LAGGRQATELKKYPTTQAIKTVSRFDPLPP